MVKTYFVKYLPVEGEINWGSSQKYFTPEGILRNVHDAVMMPEGYDYHINNSKLAKLFLCSRDIKVGDKFKYQDEEDICVDLLKGDVRGKKDQYSAQACYKVIGEISSEATWVVENQEFDRDALEPWLHCNKHPNESTYMEIEELEQWNKLNPSPTYYTPMIKVKCPNCKHFH